MTRKETPRSNLVQNWAREKNIDQIVLLGRFEGSDIYRNVIPEHLKHCKIGFPVFIVDDGKDIRFCKSSQETFEIMDHFIKENRARDE